MSDDYLERIAIALERIADSLDGKKKPEKETPFPWHECSVRTRNCEMRARGEGMGPTTVERLIKIGRHAFIEGRAWRNLGKLTVLENFDPIMERLGFEEQWHKS